MKGLGHCLLIVTTFVSSTVAQEKGIGSIFLKLLEPIAPQSSKESQAQGEVVTSDLGDLLKDPKNEALKAVKVIGVQKRLKGDSKEFTMITWKEVALETSQETHTSGENAFLKEPVEKPLESSFVQSSEAVEPGTPIEAKGDTESLLAAARTLMIRAQKQGFKGDSVSGKGAAPIITVQGLEGQRGEKGSLQESSEDSKGSNHPQRSNPLPLSAQGSSKNASPSVSNAERKNLMSGSGFSEGDQRRGEASSQVSKPRDSSYNGFSSHTSLPNGGYGVSDFSADQGWRNGHQKREKKEKDSSQNSPLTVSIVSSEPGVESSSERGLGDSEERGQRRGKSHLKTFQRGRSASFSEGRQSFEGGSETNFDPNQPQKKTSSKNPKRRGRSASFSEGRRPSDEGDGTANNPSSNDSEASSSETETFDQGRSQRKGTLRSKASRSGPVREGGDHALDDQGYDFPFANRRQGEDKRKPKAAAIRVEYDYKACSPRVDWGLNQVILQAQALTFEGQTKVSESECADTHKKFFIQKDFMHSDCFDVVEKTETPLGPTGFGFAYATYKPYWMNEASERVYLKEPQKDEDHPFALQEEEGRCSYAVDVEAMKATPQSELVYSNRTKQCTLVEPCRPSFEAKSIPIQATKKGCGIVHQFDQNRSMPQQRLIYTVKGVEHEVLPCHDESKTWIKHQFDPTVCKPVVDESTKTQQPFAKRFIKVGNEKITISECEPYGTKTPLLRDEKACSHKPYHHDLVGGQSYLNIRYYYDHSYGKKYVTGCQPSTTAFKHQKTLAGYVHDDINKISKPKSEISFTHDGQKVCVVPAKVDEDQMPAPYIKDGEKTETKAYQAKMNDRCYQEQRFKQKALFKRVDGTVYEQAIQDKVATVDRCVRTKEKKEDPDFVTVMGCVDDFANGGPANTFDWGEVTFIKYGYHPFDAHHLYHTYPSRGYFWKTDKLMERIKTIYPDSPHPEYTAWEWTGYYRDHSLTAGMHGGAAIYPPIEGKTWHHTERKF